MNEVRIFISVFVLNFPIFLLCTIPFLEKLKIKLSSLLLIIVVNIMFLSLFYVMINIYFAQTKWVDTIGMILFYMLFLYEYKKCFDIELAKLIYVFLIAQVYANMLNIASQYLSAHFFPESVDEFIALPQTLILGGFMVITYPFVYQFLKNRLHDALDMIPVKNFWQLCISPILLFIVNMIYLSTFDQFTYHDVEVFLIYILMIISGLITYFVSLRIALDAAKAVLLESEREALKDQMELQTRSYLNIIQMLDVTKKAQHDLHHHMAVIHAYLEQDDQAYLKEYLTQYMQQLPKEQDVVICSNYAVNAVVQYYISLLKDNDVEVNLKLDFSNAEGISDADFCIIFGNLFENAVISLNKQQLGHKFLHAECSVIADNFMILVENSCDDHYLRKKGIGQRSILAIANANHGTARFELNEHVYESSVMLRIKS